MLRGSSSQTLKKTLFAIIAIVRFITSQVAHNVGFGKNEFSICEKINDALFMEYACVLLCNFVFLWLRQRTFYTNKMFNFGYNKILKVLSGLSIFVLFGAGLAIVIISAIPIHYSSSPKGCRYDSASGSLNAWLWALRAITPAIGQVLMLILLVYPLSKNIDGLQQFCFCFSRQTDNSPNHTSSPSLSSPSKSKAGSDLRNKQIILKPISGLQFTKRSSDTEKKS